WPRSCSSVAWSNPRLLALAAQMGRHGFEHAFEHIARRRLAAGMQRAVSFGLFLGSDHRIGNLGFCLLVPFLRPHAAHDQMVLEPQYGIAERPGVGFGR